jgi:hypothetical protein
VYVRLGVCGMWTMCVYECMYGVCICLYVYMWGSISMHACNLGGICIYIFGGIGIYVYIYVYSYVCEMCGGSV